MGGRLREVADIGPERTSNLITRENAQRKAVISTNVADGYSTIKVGADRVQPSTPEIEWDGKPWQPTQEDRLVGPVAVAGGRFLGPLIREVLALLCQRRTLRISNERDSLLRNLDNTGRCERIAPGSQTIRTARPRTTGSHRMPLQLRAPSSSSAG